MAYSYHSTQCTMFFRAQESRGVLRLASTPTASYIAVLDNKGDYKFGVGDMKIHQQLTVDKVLS